jgi:putative oxidoreductase
MTEDRLEPWMPRALSILRMMTGLLFLEHGTQKLLGFPPSEHAFPPLFSRPVAFILAGNMAVAYFMAHAPRGFFPTLNGGQLAILFCFVFLYLAVAGGGQWSVDTQIARRRSIA